MFDIIDKAIINKLSGDISLVEEPYKKIAEELGITEREVLNRIKEFQDKEIIRRIGAILYHREVGYKWNAMVVWAVPQDSIEKTASLMCSFKEVTHCYERPTCSSWPYNIFTMIHGESKKQCESIVKQIYERVNSYDYKILYSLRELKKSSKKYF
ncbi:AsnC family transcriptional regulator [Clostridium thailandense]|uniref:siroheme decarboxylase n=1 Tax=Clostridium thailandense TaxID=2794346 RepID=A0A949TM25_9CLOT|nr:AsnC family transcriptional regulator [Clostridium thailandense]MBV7272942.1 AsnC family transcriptional regulator [Clostridium thailandense]MCH5136247.1 AsnC family transcriptional regulator [Clostridiaceae bacterium UIB06]